MIVLITGASHTGKTALAQRLLEKYKFPYLSIDHLKMGLIRSGNTTLTPTSDDKLLTDYLWKIVREMIKTAIENKQNLIVEGCYIPFDWAKDFEQEYLDEIRFYCLVMSGKYIDKHFDKIRGFASIVENRIEDDYTPETARRENAYMLEQCQKYGAEYILIDEDYRVDIELQGKYNIRRVGQGDEQTLAHIQTESWKAAFRGILDEDTLQKSTDIGHVTEMYRKLLAEGKGNGYILEIEGKAHCIAYWDKARDSDFADAAEIICIHSLQSNWRKGFGSRMMDRLLKDIAAAGYSKVVLWVFEENRRARGFYEAKGFIATEKTKSALGTAEICYEKNI